MYKTLSPNYLRKSGVLTSWWLPWTIPRITNGCCFLGGYPFKISSHSRHLSPAFIRKSLNCLSGSHGVSAPPGEVPSNDQQLGMVENVERLNVFGRHHRDDFIELRLSVALDKSTRQLLTPAHHQFNHSPFINLSSRDRHVGITGIVDGKSLTKNLPRIGGVHFRSQLAARSGAEHSHVTHVAIPCHWISSC